MRSVVRALHRAEVKEWLFNAVVEVLARLPEEFATTIKQEMIKWGKLIKAARFRE